MRLSRFCAEVEQNREIVVDSSSLTLACVALKSTQRTDRPHTPAQAMVLNRKDIAVAKIVLRHAPAVLSDSTS